MKKHSIAIALLIGFCSVTGKPDPSPVIRATALLNQINPQPSTINQTPVSQAPRFTSGFTDLTNLAQNTHTTRFSIQNSVISFQNNSNAQQPAMPEVVSSHRQRHYENLMNEMDETFFLNGLTRYFLNRPEVISNSHQRTIEPEILDSASTNLLDQFNEVTDDNNNQLSDNDSSSDDGWVYEAINQDANHSTQYMLQINEPIWEEVIRQHNERI